jgi:hypothetical protein
MGEMLLLTVTAVVRMVTTAAYKVKVLSFGIKVWKNSLVCLLEGLCVRAALRYRHVSKKKDINEFWDSIIKISVLA